jgi:ribosomal protein S18 acetylase RimI-like enzyme
VTNIERRPERETDEPFLRRLYASTRAEELASLGWSAHVLDAFVSMQFDLQRTQYRETFPQAEFLVLTLDDEPVGRLYLDHVGDDDLIIDIALLPDYRRRGFGSTVLGQVLSDADADSRGVRVTVGRDNPAQHLYQRLGFVLVHEDAVNRGMLWVRDPTLDEPTDTA